MNIKLGVYSAAFIGTLIGCTQEAQKPNIVLVFFDDMGYADFEPYGMTAIPTPNVNQLAQEGMRFTHFNAAQAVCSASRAALLTGCYSNRVGISGALMPTSEIALNPGEDYNVIDSYPEIVDQILTVVEEAREDLGDGFTGRKGKNVREPANVVFNK